MVSGSYPRRGPRGPFDDSFWEKYAPGEMFTTPYGLRYDSGPYLDFNYEGTQWMAWLTGQPGGGQFLTLRSSVYEIPVALNPDEVSAITKRLSLAGLVWFQERAHKPRQEAVLQGPYHEQFWNHIYFPPKTLQPPPRVRRNKDPRARQRAPWYRRLMQTTSIEGVGHVPISPVLAKRVTVRLRRQSNGVHMTLSVDSMVFRDRLLQRDELAGLYDASAKFFGPTARGLRTWVGMSVPYVDSQFFEDTGRGLKFLP